MSPQDLLLLVFCTIDDEFLVKAAGEPGPRGRRGDLPPDGLDHGGTEIFDHYGQLHRRRRDDPDSDDLRPMAMAAITGPRPPPASAGTLREVTVAIEIAGDQPGLAGGA